MALADQIKRRREDAGLSQAKLAELAGTNQQTIDRIEKGAHSRALPRVLQALKIHDEAPLAAPIVEAALPRMTGGDLPVYASARGGPGEMLFTHEPIDYVGRPDPLVRVKDGYAMYIVGESMSPAFEQGDLALINPHLPYRGGDDVLVFRQWDGEFAAVIKRLVRAASEEWHLEQFNPAKKFKLPRQEWPTCHVIVGKYSRR